MALEINVIYVPITRKGIITTKDVKPDGDGMRELRKLSEGDWEVKAATPIADSLGETKGIVYTLQR